MILYFANREMQILGQASTILPNGFVILDDLKSEDVDTGVATFECKIGFDKENRLKLEGMTNAGNYLLRSDGDENEFYTIIDSEIDTKNQEVYIYAEDAGLDLLNEVVGAFEATESHTAEWYINKYTNDSGFEIGINEIPSTSTRKLSWDGEATATERLASIATQFGGYEISFSFAINGMEVSNKYINIYKERGKSIEEPLMLNRDIDRIITKKSVANLATAFLCTGGIPKGKDKPITLEGYEYDDGDFYVSGKYVKSREAVNKWSRYVWNKEPNQQTGYAGHIVRRYTYDTTSQKTLCSHAITELKKICDMEVNYEVDINRLPDTVRIGDRVNIVDDAGELYLSARILKFDKSAVNKSYKATLGEYLIKDSGISQKVEDLAAQFAELAANRTFYTWIAYADDETGAGISLDPAGKEYMGTAANQASEEVDISDPSIFKWSKIKGEQGEQGIPGTNGTDGKTSYFHIKYSSVSNPTSSSQMTETPSEYIGTYVDYTSTDSTDPSKYTWARFQGLQGETGEQGIPGTNGSDGKTSYLHIKYSNDGGSTFTSNNGETAGDYIGQYVDYTQADSTSVSAYTWSKIKGDTGRGTQNVTRYYILQSSTAAAPSKPTTNPPPSGWTDTEPTYTSGSTDSLYFCDLTVFSDGTWAYSEVSKSSSYEASKEAYNKAAAAQDDIDNLEIGGRNLFLGTKDFSGSKWQNRNVQFYNDGDIKYAKLFSSPTQSWITYMGQRVPLDADTEYIMSALIKKNTDEDVTMCWRYDSSESRNNHITITSTEWTRVVFPYQKRTNSAESEYVVLFVPANSVCVSSETAIDIAFIKFEKGNKATDWTPAPEDVDADISEAAKTATNFMGYDGTNGLLIGNKTSGSWSGYRSQMLPTAFNILDANGNTLSSFGANDIELGLNNDDATINLCNGQAMLKATGDGGALTDFMLYSDKRLVMRAYRSALINCYRSEGYYSQIHVDSYDPDDTSFNGQISLRTYGLEKGATLDVNHDGINLNVTGAAESDGTIRLYRIMEVNRNEINANADFNLLSNTFYGDRIRCMFNGHGIAGVDSSGNQVNMMYVGTTDILNVGGGSAPPAKILVNSTSETRLETKNAGVMLDDGGTSTTYDGYFHPTTDNKVSCGRTSYRWTRVYAANSSISTSDKRQKKNIKPIKERKYKKNKNKGKVEEVDLYSELFDKLQPCEYEFIEGEQRVNFGLIAQDVLEAMAELGIEEDELDLVHHDIETVTESRVEIDSETGEEKLIKTEKEVESFGLAYENIIAMLINEVQNLKAEVYKTKKQNLKR